MKESACNFSNHCASNIPFTFYTDKRIEFTAYVNGTEDVFVLLTAISNLKVNVNAYTFETDSCNRTIFRFIPANKNAQSKPDVDAVRYLLKGLEINFDEDEVLKVTVSGGPGSFAKAICTLNDNVDIYYSYLTEDGSQIFGTSSICKAINAINSLMD